MVSTLAPSLSLPNKKCHCALSLSTVTAEHTFLVQTCNTWPGSLTNIPKVTTARSISVWFALSFRGILPRGPRRENSKTEKPSRQNASPSPRDATLFPSQRKRQTQGSSVGFLGWTNLKSAKQHLRKPGDSWRKTANKLGAISKLKCCLELWN